MCRDWDLPLDTLELLLLMLLMLWLLLLFIKSKSAPKGVYWIHPDFWLYNNIAYTWAHPAPSSPITTRTWSWSPWCLHCLWCWPKSTLSKIPIISIKPRFVIISVILLLWTESLDWPTSKIVGKICKLDWSKKLSIHLGKGCLLSLLLSLVLDTSPLDLLESLLLSLALPSRLSSFL